MYLARKYLVRTLFLRPLLETGPPFYVVIRAARRSIRLQGKAVPSFLSYFKTLSTVNSLLDGNLWDRHCLSILERCPSYNESTKRSKERQGITLGVHLTEASITQRCLSHRGVHLTEMSISQRCPSHRNVHLTEVSITQRCLSHRGVHLTEVSISQKCPSHRGVHLTEVSISQRCPSHRGVHLTEVSISQKRPFHRSVRLTEVSVKRELTVLVQSWESNQRHPALQSSALLTELQ